MSQAITVYQKLYQEPEITSTEPSMENEKSPQNNCPFEIIYDYRNKLLETNRKLFYLSRRRFLRKIRKQESERKRQTVTNNLRTQREMELIESFINLECSESDLLERKSNQIERAQSKRKDFLFQNFFQPFEYRT